MLISEISDVQHLNTDAVTVTKHKKMLVKKYDKFLLFSLENLCSLLTYFT